MERYSVDSIDKKERSREPHPVWRGIGFIMMVLIPVVSFALGDVLLQFAKERGFRLPVEMRSGIVEIPLYGEVHDLRVVLVLAGVIMLGLFALLTIINAIVYRASAKNTYQVFESAPKKYKKKRDLY